MQKAVSVGSSSGDSPGHHEPGNVCVCARVVPGEGDLGGGGEFGSDGADADDIIRGVAGPSAVLTAAGMCGGEYGGATQGDGGEGSGCGGGSRSEGRGATLHRRAVEQFDDTVASVTVVDVEGAASDRVPCWTRAMVGSRNSITSHQMTWLASATSVRN